MQCGARACSHSHSMSCCPASQVLATQQSLLTAGGCLLRSKGFVWLASCPDRVVEWSSSGLLLEVCMAHPWFCTLKEVGRVRGGEGGGCKIWVLGIYDGEGLQLLEPKPTFHTPDSVS
jgi:hypothetical protein